jgi:3-oxoacyl-[acyl-carrier-protein] synthase II
VFIERLEDAKRRQAQEYGELAGYAINTDATDFVLPNPEAQGAVRRTGAPPPGLSPDQIDIVSTPATGTDSGDIQECAGRCGRPSANRPGPASTTPKSFIGHAIGAAPEHWSSRATCPRSTMACATRRSTSMNWIQPASCQAWWDQAREIGHPQYVLNNSFGMLGVNSVAIIKKFSV